MTCKAHHGPHGAFNVNKCAANLYKILQAASALVNAAVRLVTHLASVPISAAQFRTVLLDMPAESRQQLQVCHWCIYFIIATCHKP